MADLKISALNSLAGADLVAADVVAVVDDSASETKKLTVSDLIANGTTLISDNTIPSAKILFSAGAIDTAELAASSVETAKINDSAVTAAKLADNSSVTLVSTLPASGDFTGQIALDTDDDKIYVWDGSAWDSVKGAGSINVVNGSTTGEINIVTSTSGDTVTVSATLDDTTAAAQFLAGPTGAGGTVGYRAIIGTDLPTATTTAKGGVIVNGNGLTMSSDTIAIDNTVTAETSENHIVQYDANGLITGGRAIVAADVPNATSTTVGVIKPGSGLGVTAAGELNHDNSVTAGTASKVTFDTEGHITGTESLVAADIPDLDADKITTGTLPTARIASDAVTADKLADRSTATIAETTPAGGAFIGQTHLNSITGDYFLWDGNVWQPIGISVGEIVLAGTYDASTNLVATVTSEGTAVGYEVGSALPAASDSNKGYYVIVSEAGTGTSPAPTVALNPPDFLLSNGSVHTEIDVSDTVTAQQASNVQFTAAGNIAATNVQSAIEELDTEKVGAASPTFTGTVSLGEDAVITFEGATDNAFESTLTVVDPTADRTLSLPDVSGTLVSTGDTGTVTSTMITDGTIVNADINASAEIAVSKLANGTARQLLQTDVAGSGVEFTSNVDVPGTLDVTGAATLDSTLTVTGVISADGKVKFPAGSASAPSFYSGTDTNTGLYFSAADEISVATGGTQRVVVDSAGRLLVGATSAASIGSQQFRFNVSGESFANSGTVQVRYGASGGPTAIFANARGTTASPATLQNSDELGKIRFYGHDGTDFANYAAAIQAEVDGTPGSNDMPGRLIFQTTADGSGTPTERLRIDSSGRVIIGATNPDGFKFKVTESGGNLARFTNGSTQTMDVVLDSSGATFQNPNNGYIAFKGSSAERLRIDSSGRLLVGTSSSAGSNRRFQIAGTDANGASMSICRNTNNNDGVTIDYIKSRNGTYGSSTIVQSGDTIGKIQFRGDDGTDYISQAASILAAVDGTPGTNDMPGRLVFSTTADGASSPTERLRIDSSGDVQARRARSNTTGDVALSVQPSDSTIHYGLRIDSTNNSLNLDRASGTAANLLVIDSSGNVGIGTTSPASFLHIDSNNTYGSVVLSRDGGSSGRRPFGIGLSGSADDHLRISVSSDTTGTNAFANQLIEITSEGNVGIGTSSPTFPSGKGLEINDSSSPRLKLSNDTTGTGSTDGSYLYVSGSDFLIENKENANMRFYTNATERLRIDSSGKVGINISNPGSYNSSGNELVLGNTGNNGGMTIVSGTGNNGHIFFADGTSGGALNRGIIKYEHGNDAMAFNTAETERMRITSAGAFKSSTDGTYQNVSSTSHEFCQSNASVYALRIEHSGTTPSGILIDYSAVTQNDTGSSFIQGEDATTFRFRFASNGGLYNYSGNDSNLCDEREKKNIETLDSTWGCLKNWELKKFHYNEDADADDKRYGVIAQQVEQHCPEVISDWIKQSAAEAVLDDDGNVVTPAREEILRKGVKEQQMMWMAIKALQEAQDRIETLEAKVAALEAE